MLKDISRALLAILGWRFPDIEKLRSTKKVVLLFPHTSFWDAPLAILFRLAYLDDMNVKLLLDHRFYTDWTKKPCDRLGFIPVGQKGRKNTVKEVSDFLNKLDNFIFIISPEGALAKVDKMKSGFYHIAKNTNADIAIVNLDYQKHTMEYHGPWKIEETIEKEMSRLKKFFSLTPPLYPENTNYAEHYFPIRDSLYGCKWNQVIGCIIFICLFFFW